VLGNGETCTGDPARRAGNEFVYQGLAAQNVETLTEHRVKQVVTTCAHCFNTLKNEYRDLGLELEVVHHTQLLNRLVREGRLTPVASGAGAAQRTITYHDPCYLGRHNQVYTPPRELLQVLPGASYVEMERSAERSFCCGAGGARMWMEENLGERINTNRTKEAVATGADQIAVGLPVLPGDALRRPHRRAGVRSCARGGRGPRRGPDAAGLGEGRVRDPGRRHLALRGDEGGARAGRRDPGIGDRHEDGGRGSGGEGIGWFVPLRRRARGEPQREPEPQPAPDPGPSAGGSLFDVAADEPEPTAEATPTAGGSLFDVARPVDVAADEPEPTAEATPTAGGSLFDVAADEPEPEEPAREPEPEKKKDEGGSLFDL
jgi:hypothetical protein